jgi:hypothetical protein
MPSNTEVREDLKKKKRTKKEKHLRSLLRSGEYAFFLPFKKMNIFMTYANNKQCFFIFGPGASEPAR